jgi:hypothetical protein
MSSRIVEIKRVSMGRQDRIYPDSKKNIGSTMTQSGEVAYGISYDEIKKYMPSIVNADPTEFNFRAKVEDYFKSLTIRPPKDGLKLNIGLDDHGNPLNPTDYVHYKFILQNPKVASNKENIVGGITMFVVEDREEILKESHSLLEKRRNAYKEFILLLEDKKKLAAVLAILSSDLGYGIMEIRNVDSREVHLKLENFVQNNPERFSDIVNDKNLALKAFVEDCISAGVLNRIGTAILNGDQRIGNTIEETCLFLSDKANSEIFVTLRARVDEFKKVTKS